MSIKITSTVFENNDLIPRKYTCDGLNISPPLEWENLPKQTKTIAIICDDPDAPVKVWVHWVIYNIPPTIHHLKEEIGKQKVFENGTEQGINDFGFIGYGGPCPPKGIHRYQFKIYAIDKKIELQPGINKEQLLKAMDGHILEQNQLIGKYGR